MKFVQETEVENRKWWWWPKKRIEGAERKDVQNGRDSEKSWSAPAEKVIFVIFFF